MIFTDTELEYLAGPPLGRIATAQTNGTLQVSPVGFRDNQATAAIDVGGHNMARSQKFRNVAANGRVSIVVDNLLSTDPRRPRFLEIRGQGPGWCYRVVWAPPLTWMACPVMCRA